MRGASYQPADVIVPLDRGSVTLRLTLGALSEISHHLAATGPTDLASRLREINTDDALILLQALLRPCHADLATSCDTSMITGEIMTAIASIFERSFSIFSVPQ